MPDAAVNREKHPLRIANAGAGNTIGAADLPGSRGPGGCQAQKIQARGECG